MPSFPSYYLNNLERKRQRSRELREGLNEGMAGVLGGVDRLAQMQAALEEKGLRAEALKAKTATEADETAYKREQDAIRNSQADRKYWLELRKNATQGNAALGGEPASAPTPPGESSSDVLAKMQGYLSGESERPGGPQTEEPPPMSVYDLDKAAEVAEEGEPETTTSDIFARLESTLSEERPMAAPIVPSNADRIEEERLRAAQLKNQILERKATTPTAAPRPKAAPTGPTTKEQIDAERLAKAKADRLLAERKVEEMQRDPALANAPPTILQFWGNVKGTAEQMRNLGKEVTPDDFSLVAKAQSQMPTIAQSDRVRRVTSMIDRIVQRAGVGMEGGKLAEGDISRYRAMLMNAMDSYEGFTAATQEIAAELDKKVIDEQAMFRGGDAAAPDADPQTAFLKTATDLAKQLGRKPTKEELQDAMRAAGVLE